MWLLLACAIAVLVAVVGRADAQSTIDGAAAVGLERLEFTDPSDGGRTLSLSVFYPADLAVAAGAPFEMPFFTNVSLHEGAALAEPTTRRPLVVFSHGRGSNGLYYAWFAQALASRGYVVAAIDHYRANTYDATIAYLANQIWQRPRDVGLAISHMVGDPKWAAVIDAGRIGVAGHSQGGFTALWIGGATVDADRFLAFQRRWRNNKMVPEHLRADLPLDPAPALAVHDPRVRAVFAMAPGIVKAFGMTEAGLARLTVPTYITVGARDTQTPPAENAAFAAAHVPGAELAILPGDVDHEIFVNECDEEGRDEFPEACIDAPGVDRHAIHADVAAAAWRFFEASFAR